jgi:hypothetical protein
MASKTAQIRLIHEAFNAIPEMFDGFISVRESLFHMNMESERRHRRGAPNGIKHGISVNDAARLFTVQHLLDGWRELNRFSIDDITSIRHEVLYAQAYAKRFPDKVGPWFAKYGKQFEEVDYAELMKGGRQ